MFINLSFDDRDLDIYYKEIKDFIPDRIIDNHIHIWERDNIIPEIAGHQKYQNKPFSDINFFYEFKYSDFSEIIKKTFQGKDYEGVFFGLPLEFVNMNAANNYVISTSRKNNFKYLYIPLPGENIWESNKDFQFLSDKNFIGFKPYPDLAGVEGNEISIFDFISQSVFEFSNVNNLTIVLHLPRKLRLKSYQNIKEILQISKKYKNIRLILAHCGRAFCVTDLIGNLEKLKNSSNIYYDIALINEHAVLEYLIKNVGIDKIIFGSDLPMGFIKGKDVCINNNHYYVTENQYKWALAPVNKELVNFTLYIYEEIRALLYAIKNVKGKYYDSWLEKIFYNNFKDICIRKN